MAPSYDPFENARKLLAEPAVLRRLRDATELSRRLSGSVVASNLDRLTKAVPPTAQMPVMNVGRDVTRLLAGSSAVTAWADAQAAHARIAQMMTPQLALSAPTISALRELDELSERLSMHTRLLAGMRLPNLLAQATADSTRGWHHLVDQLAESPTIQLQSTHLAGTFAVGTAVSARIIRPTVLDIDDDEVDVEAQDPVPLVNALSIGDDYRQQVRHALQDLDPRLLERWDGAWATLLVEGPDGPSQAAHSIQELVDWTLRLAAPSADVLAWHAANGGLPGELNDRGEPTRGLMVRYILGPRAQDKTAKLFISSLNKIVEALQQAKHGFEGPTGPAMIRSVLLNTESFIGFLLITE